MGSTGRFPVPNLGGGRGEWRTEVDSRKIRGRESEATPRGGFEGRTVVGGGVAL